MSLVIDIHALQTLPPSLINRDDTGAPKTAIYGGVPRQRVSSQSWKRAIRKYFQDHVNATDIGDRSKRLPQRIAELVQNQSGWDQSRAIQAVTDLFEVAGIGLDDPKKRLKVVEDSGAEHTEEDLFAAAYPRTKYLIFLSPHQVERAAQAILDADGENLRRRMRKRSWILITP